MSRALQTLDLLGSALCVIPIVRRCLDKKKKRII